MVGVFKFTNWNTCVVLVYWYPLIGYTLVCSWNQFVSPRRRLLRYYEPEDQKMFSKCSFTALIQAPPFSWRHTKTHADTNRYHSERDCHRSTTTTLICQLHQTILRLLSSAATASTRWRVRELFDHVRCSKTYCSRTINTLFCDSESATYTLLLYTQQARYVVTHATDNWLKSLSARWLSWLRFQWIFLVF
jgi:hypothetical protein